MINDNTPNGIIIVDKPKGITSYDVIRKLKKVLKTSKIGHTGTLDPIAEGVMIVCVGKATKLAEKIEAADKTYIAEMTFGIETDTYDVEGKVIAQKDNIAVTKEDFERVLGEFKGEGTQVPPMYSAIKLNGQKLYDLARKGIEVERKERKIFIEKINAIFVEGNKGIFEAKVSKGTYIRTIIHDVGEKLGCFGTMSGLRRTAVGEYTIKMSFSLDKIEQMSVDGDLSFLMSIEKIFEKNEEIILENDKQQLLFINGNTVVTGSKYRDGEKRIYYKGEFLGIGKVTKGLLKGDKYF